MSALSDDLERLLDWLGSIGLHPPSRDMRIVEIGSGIGTPRVRREALRRPLEYRINGRKSLDDAQARWKLHLKPMFGPVRTLEVGTTMLGRYVDTRQREGAKNATINRELALLKRMFRLGMQATPAKVLRVPAFPKLTENYVRKGFLEDSQYAKLVEACLQLWFRAMLECGRTYGWCVSELKNLRTEQLDFAERVIRLDPGTTKNGEGREVVMNEREHVTEKSHVFGHVDSPNTQVAKPESIN